MKIRNCAKWKVTDSQSTRRRAVLSYVKGDLTSAANYCKHLAYVSNDLEVKRKARLDGLYFRERAKRKNKQ